MCMCMWMCMASTDLLSKSFILTRIFFKFCSVLFIIIFNIKCTYRILKRRTHVHMRFPTIATRTHIEYIYMHTHTHAHRPTHTHMHACIYGFYWNKIIYLITFPAFEMYDIRTYTESTIQNVKFISRISIVFTRSKQFSRQIPYYSIARTLISE